MLQTKYKQTNKKKTSIKMIRKNTAELVFCGKTYTCVDCSYTGKENLTGF